jgi:hypothetical protein
MTQRGSALPPGFELLEPYVSRWCLATSDERSHLRGACDEEERVRFYEAGKRVMAEALEYLDQKPLDRLDAKEQNLMRLMLSLCHVSLAVELQGKEEAKHAALRQFMPITRSSADPVSCSRS